MEKNKISIVVPCFNEKGALPLFYNKITQVFNQMSQESETARLSYELIVVDDGSMDGTLDVAKELAINDSGVKYISFSRNFGKEAAMYAGLQHAVGEYVAIMDADLQDPPDMLPEMYFLYSLDGIVAFSNAPLYMASIAGVFSFIVAIIAMLFIIIRRLVFGDPVAGWASTVVIILFIGGIQLLSIGILGLYLSKLYLEAKDRPIYLIGESNIEKSTEKN